MPEPRAPPKPIDVASEAARASINSLSRLIQFRHPSYPPPAQPLLQLPAVDDGGVRFDLALCACGILAGNRFDGSYFTTTVRQGGGHDEDPAAVVVVVNQPPPGDGLLRASTYDFHVSNPDGNTTAGDPAAAPCPYPIVPSFDHWVFPHDHLPAPWRTASIPEASDFTSSATVARDDIVHRDVTCRVTASYLELEHAHIVPVVATAWFIQNNMARYTSRPGALKAIDDHFNGILLRRDVHSLFDKRRFTVVPAPSISSQHDFMLYTFDGRRNYGGHETRMKYHNLGLQPLKSVSPELLFARFAWSIFSDDLAPLFRSIGQRFDVIVRENGAGDVTVRRGLDLAEVMTLPGLPGPARLLSRSTSPKKRSRSGDDSDGGVDAAEAFWCLGSRDHVADWEEDDDPPRGRKRRRQEPWLARHDYGADAADGHIFLSTSTAHAQLAAVPTQTRPP